VKILITGAAGFLGSHLSQKMLGMGHSVTGLDDLSTGSERNLKELKQNLNFQFAKHDVRIPYHSDIDFILNFACPASPRHYQSDPVRTIETNFLGMINILHLARDTDASSVNWGNPTDFTMLELAQIVLEVTESDSKIEFHPLPQDDPRQRRPDISLAKSLLSWEPAVDLKAGVSLTANYFKELLS